MDTDSVQQTLARLQKKRNQIRRLTELSNMVDTQVDDKGQIPVVICGKPMLVNANKVKALLVEKIDSIDTQQEVQEIKDTVNNG
jgi:hypothetical protein